MFASFKQMQNPQGKVVLARILVFTLAAALCGCGLMSRSGKKPEAATGSANRPPKAGGDTRFEEPGELDKMLDAKPLPLPALKSASPGFEPLPPGKTNAGRGNFRVQLGAEADIESAQAKKSEYERTLGGVIDVVFDAPYYKLRWGYFGTKQEAQDKILELTELNIQGFVIKQ